MCARGVIVATQTSAIKMRKDIVAPSEYKAAYDKYSFPRSVFSQNGENKREVRSSIIRKLFLRSKVKKDENQPGVFATPVIKVSVKRKADPLRENASNDLNAGQTKRSSYCLNAVECNGGKLPNAVVNKIFKVRTNYLRVF